MTAQEEIFSEPLRRPEARRNVIALIRGMRLSDGQKRALYLRWLLAAKVPYGAGDLDDVIGSGAPEPNTGGAN